jgi:hypothetical protein
MYLVHCFVIYSTMCLVVPDHGSRDRDVVLVRRTIGSGKPPGGREFKMGREWGGGGQFTSNLGPRWTGLLHAKGGFPSK